MLGAAGAFLATLLAFRYVIVECGPDSQEAKDAEEKVKKLEDDMAEIKKRLGMGFTPSSQEYETNELELVLPSNKLPCD